MNIHERMAERMQLAGIYAEDGAFHRAAEILGELAGEVKAHAQAVERDLRRFQAGQAQRQRPTRPTR